jgi:hypothetical protein
MDEVYVSLINIISQKVVPHFYVFGSGVKHGIFGNTNGTRAITHERYMGTLLTKVTQSVCDPKQLGATTSGSNIFGFGGRLSYTRLFVRRPKQARNPKSGKYLKSISDRLDTPQSRHLINQEAKGKRTPSTKYRAHECIEDTGRSA